MNKFSILTPIVIFAVGCGGGESKMADVPTKEAIEKNEKASKEIESEERGTPIKKKR